MSENAIIKPIQTTGILPANLPAGAKAFQQAVDGKLTPDVWGEILDAQISKAKQGDRGAAKFLLEYAGGVASMRGATFVQQNHHHEHFHEAGEVKSAPRLTEPSRAPGGMPKDAPERTKEDYERDRERKARSVANALAGTGA